LVEGVNIDFLNIVIEAFLLEMPSRLESLRSALDRGDTAVVRDQAQSMKSSGAFIGIARFTGLCRKLGALALTGDTAGAAGLVSEIEAEYARVEQGLRRRLAGEIACRQSLGVWFMDTNEILADEAELAVRAATEPVAFASIYDHYLPRVYKYMRYRVGDMSEAEDLTSLVFERVLTKSEIIARSGGLLPAGSLPSPTTPSSITCAPGSAKG